MNYGLMIDVSLKKGMKSQLHRRASMLSWDQEERLNKDNTIKQFVSSVVKQLKQCGSYKISLEAKNLLVM